jgi:hypothetical protein
MSHFANSWRGELQRAHVVAQPSCPPQDGLAVARLWGQRASCPLIRTAIVAVTILILCSAFSVTQGGQVKLNENAFAYAKELITVGSVVVDKRNEWGNHHPTSQKQNEFIRGHTFSEYAKWHLGIDPTRSEGTKARHKFPFGDFKNIHRCALLAIKNRAHQYGYLEIENAASQLLEMIDSRKRE